ncbi:NAD(P)-dependent dehydrogenase (short-subunit alcohol dehydrogenase family) [Streptomonospora nanhaiensis]|uniref:NAD(P)-dependent dehydrogenase (Short-subunit alcohol dehydrogenase family) n=1 Tax=Streptomonospora nanhaiensis TaxID=1323731 RepID=A0A853BP74_9ACTN|nr:SDR family NAD(P)-dependent oxidoreductase [Streptomonospora nanhaiensis]NYI96446.1 NAD(P)-dependent dehydrogenase (short-subunit alcohol dehydrogenase family) [Streptomonospora nanhaiensis]
MSGAVVIGAGPGIGQAVARRFAREGMAVAVLARTAQTVRAAEAALAPFGVPTAGLRADSADEDGLRAALDAAAERLGPPDAVVYNAAVVRADAVGDLSAREHLDTYAVNVLGALTAAAHTAPGMAARGGGTFIVTGGMPRAKAAYASLSLGKAAVRTLVDLLHLQYGPANVHAASVTVDGPVAAGTAFDPDLIAEHYWHLHTEPRERWRHEVLHTDQAV